MSNARVALIASVLASLAGAGCTLEEITLAEAEDVVVGEVYVQVSAGPGGESRATAWLHRTLEGGSPTSRPVPGAEVLITSSRGLSLELAETADKTCVWSTPVEGTGTCYATSSELAGELRPGDVLEVEIALPGGGLIRGASTVPGDFRLVTPGAEGRCRVNPPTRLQKLRLMP